METRTDDVRVPRDANDDYSAAAIASRRAFVERKTGATLEHASHVSFDTNLAKGNIEHFTGVVQVPLGFAGPLAVRGEHAMGDFYVPMATTEGTLLASYGRGMRITRAAGGITTTVVGDAMQRAPVFGFASAKPRRSRLGSPRIRVRSRRSPRLRRAREN